MGDQRTRGRRQSAMIAFCGMTAGVSIVLMLLGGVIPIATYAVPMLCGVLLLPVLLEFGKTAAWATFFAVAALALMLSFDKEAAFFYLFIGYYPIVKWPLDRIKPKLRSIAVKAALFLGAIGVMYGVMYLLFPMDAFMQEWREMGVALIVAFAVIYVGCMFLFDRLLVGLVAVYANRIRPKLTFLRRM